MSRRASDAEVGAWQGEGWVVLHDLLDTADLAPVDAELAGLFPTAAEYHADPTGVRAARLGQPPPARDEFVWPAEGPGFRPEQHTWRAEFPFGATTLNRMCIHPALVDFAERALGSEDIRLYQAGVSAKYAGEANYEQPMHTDRNHSWLPAHPGAPWRNLQLFVYLSDVEPGNAPTHVVGRSDAGDRSTAVWGVMPKQDPELYAAERPAVGRRGSVLAYRSDVFHRGVDLTGPGAARFMLGVSYKIAGQDWIGFHAPQSNATALDWVALVEELGPRELSLFGFPPPGHPIWDEAFLDATAERYPKLDLGPWRAALQRG